MVPLDKVCAKVGENRPSTLGDMARQSGLLSKKGLCHAIFLIIFKPIRIFLSRFLEWLPK